MATILNKSARSITFAITGERTKDRNSPIKIIKRFTLIPGEVVVISSEHLKALKDIPSFARLSDSGDIVEGKIASKVGKDVEKQLDAEKSTSVKKGK